MRKKQKTDAVVYIHKMRRDFCQKQGIFTREKEEKKKL